MTAAWVCLAGALMVLPARDRTPAGDRSTVRARSSRAGGPGRRGPALAALAVAAACLAEFGPGRGAIVAAIAGPAVLVAMQTLVRRPVAAGFDRTVALPLDLAAAALRSGRTLADALMLCAPAAAPASAALLTRIAGLLRLGAPADEAWALIAPGHPLAGLAAAAVRSSSSGIKLADAFERHAAEVRAESTARSTARAQRAGTAALGPLAACFLPSFVCLGIAPTVVGIATRVFGGLR